MCTIVMQGLKAELPASRHAIRFFGAVTQAIKKAPDRKSGAIVSGCAAASYFRRATTLSAKAAIIAL